MLLSTCCEDDVVPHVLPFIREHIENPDWRYRDASVMAFGSILEGPDLTQLKALVMQVGAPPTNHPPTLSIKLLVLATISKCWSSRAPGGATGQERLLEQVSTSVSLPWHHVKDTRCFNVNLQ